MAANNSARYSVFESARTTNTANPPDISKPGRMTGLRPHPVGQQSQQWPEDDTEADVQGHVDAYPEGCLIGPIL